jgi:NDP-sugar pyrophosphorylase family protein
MLPLAILCGGLGTRMLPHTLRVPKPMIGVNGEPFLGHLLRSVAAQGVRDVILLVGYLGKAIADFAGDGSDFGLGVRCVVDGTAPLGTGGAVRAALPLLGERFFVTFGDALLQVDYAAVLEAFERCACDGLMTVYRSSADSERPNTNILAGRVVRYDKKAAPAEMQYVDYGLSAFRATAFVGLAPGVASDLAIVNRSLIDRGQLAAFVVEQPPFEIGSPSGLRATEAYLRSKC